MVLLLQIVSNIHRDNKILMETPQMIIRTKTPLLQTAKQIHQPLAQQETLSLEKSEMLVAPLHLEKSNKRFWNFIKPFITNKGMVASNDITLIEGMNVITNEYEISQTINKHHTNIAEKSCGNKPNKTGTTLSKCFRYFR